MINVLGLIDSFEGLVETGKVLGNFLVSLVKYIILVPAFVLKIIEFLIVMISFIPQPFRTIEYVFLSIMIGFFGIKMIGKVT